MSCTSTPASGHALLLISQSHETPSLAVLDVADPVHPVQLCTLSPAMGGRFISATRIAFWFGTQVGVADLVSSRVSPTAALPKRATVAAISPDGASFAYGVGDDTNGSSLHLYSGGSERTLFSRPAVGGHGGPSYGPLFQLSFSPDGRYLFSYEFFTATNDPVDKFQVYGADGTIAFKSGTAAYGAWAPSGARLYFLHPSQPSGITGEVRVWDPVAGEKTTARGPTSFFWPVVSPDGRFAMFTSYDRSGFPRLWRLDLTSGAVSQLTTAMSSRPLFVGGLSLWAAEERQCECGPGGNSAPTGRILSRDLDNGRESVVSFPGPTTTVDQLRSVLDVWIN